jgi:hypothetical protein
VQIRGSRRIRILRGAGFAHRPDLIRRTA